MIRKLDKYAVFVLLGIVKEIKQYQEKWLQHIQRMGTNRIPNKHYNINQKDEDT